MIQEKRVCLINVKDITVEGQDTILAGERVMRTTRKFAEELIVNSNGTWAYTSKGKLKSFLNKNGKLTRAMRVIDTLQNITGDSFKEKRERSSYGIKSYVLVPTFKYEHEKGEYDRIKVPEIPHQIKHKYPKYVQTIFPKKVINIMTGEIIEQPMMFKNVLRKHLFTKKQKLVQTGQKKVIIAFP